MTTQLSLYNGALRILKERRLSSLTENREPRRLLDDVWGNGATDGAVQFCLEMGQWTFATRTVEAEASPSIEPSFGYRYAFDQPDDLVRVTGVYCDPQCNTPLLQYVDERRYWYSNQTPMYVSYVSNSTSYGADLSLWPETFAKMVEAYLATAIAGNLTSSTDLIRLADAAMRKAKLDASSLDAMKKPSRYFPQGSWSRARHGDSRRSSLWDERG